MFSGLVRVARSFHRARRPDYVKLAAWTLVILGAWGLVWLIVAIARALIA